MQRSAAVALLSLSAAAVLYGYDRGLDNGIDAAQPPGGSGVGTQSGATGQSAPAGTPGAQLPAGQSSSPQRPQPGAAGPLVDGLFNGAPSSHRYGTVQVQILVRDGAIDAAGPLQTPDADATTRQINASAVPQLNQSAVRAQSADIDAVTGATLTSNAYRTSLQSAIDAARS